jgi:hypothetical protein
LTLALAVIEERLLATLYTDRTWTSYCDELLAGTQLYIFWSVPPEKRGVPKAVLASGKILHPYASARVIINKIHFS